MCKCERCGNKIDCGDPVCQKTIPWCFGCSKLVVTIPPTLLVDQDGTGHYVEDKNSPVGRVIPSTKKRKKKQEVKIFSNIILQIIYESKKLGVNESLKFESKTVGPIIHKALECINFFSYKFSINGKMIEDKEKIEFLNRLLASYRDSETISIEVYINNSTMDKSEAERFLKEHRDELFELIFGELITKATSISKELTGIKMQTEFIEWMSKFRSELYKTMESDEKFLSHIHNRCIGILEEGERHILSNIPTKAKLDDVVKILEIDISESKKEIHSRLVSISEMFDEISDRITKEFNIREKIGRLKRAIDRTKEKRKAGKRTRFNVGGTLSDDSDEDEYAKKVQAWIVKTPGEPVLCVKEKGQYWMYLKRKSKILEIQRKTRGEKPLVGDNYPTLGKQLQRLSVEDNKRFLEQLSNLLKSKDSRSKYCTKLDLTNDSLANMYDDLELNPQNAASLVFATLLVSEEGPGRIDTGGKYIRGIVDTGIQKRWTLWEVLQKLPHFYQFGVRVVRDLVDNREFFPDVGLFGKKPEDVNTYIRSREGAVDNISQFSTSQSSTESESEALSLCNKSIEECDCKK